MEEVPTKKKKRAPGGGNKPDDLSHPLTRRNMMDDPETHAILLRIGRGNVSLGAREAARRAVENGDDGPFDYERHCERNK